MNSTGKISEAPQFPPVAPTPVTTLLRVKIVAWLVNVARVWVLLSLSLSVRLSVIRMYIEVMIGWYHWLMLFFLFLFTFVVACHLIPSSRGILLSVELLILHVHSSGFDVVIIKNLRVPKYCISCDSSFLSDMNGAHIIIFHVSTGKSASLKLQSNFSSATGSSVGSW